MNGANSNTAAGLSRFRPISFVVILFATLILAACGVDDEDDPTPAATAPPPATAPVSEAPVPPPATSPDATASGTPAAMTNTVGRLAEGIAAIWPQTSYRRVQTSTAAPSATPAAGLVSLTITDEVLYPGSVHRTIVDGNGATSAEFILIDGQLFARGDLIPALFTTGTDPQTWIELAGPQLDPGTAGANILSQLEALLLPRYSGLAPEQQAREAILTSETNVDGRACFVFQTAETTPTGERLQVSIALEPSGLLCSVTTTGGGLDTVETFTFDVPVTVTAPAEVATPAVGTPVASPVASPPATPVATPAG